ncbi:DNA helicase [Ranunculus cassubicifolius]
MAKLRSENKIVLAVASSGIASLLLPGGRTGHSRFKIPLDVDEYTTCCISKGTHLAELISRADLILWGEAPMCNKHVFETVDRTFRDILEKDDKFFGGKTVLLGGDFRQVIFLSKHFELYKKSYLIATQ